MDINKYQIEITRHAMLQAYARGIHPDLIEQTIRTGKVKSQGKHAVRFISKGNKRTIICIGRICEETLTILTVEEGN